MKVVIKYFVVIVLLLFVVFYIWLVFSPVSPHLLFASDGTVKVIGCDANAPQNYHIDCMSLYCEKKLFEKEIIPYGMSVIRRFQRYNISNRKGVSIHYVHYTAGDLSVFATCEMKGVTPITTRKISEEEFESFFGRK